MANMKVNGSLTAQATEVYSLKVGNGELADFIVEVGSNYYITNLGKMVEFGSNSIGKNGTATFPRPFKAGTTPTLIGSPANDNGNYRNWEITAQDNATIKTYTDTTVTWNWVAFGEA